MATDGGNGGPGKLLASDREKRAWLALAQAKPAMRELWLNLWLEEYKSLRNESEQSRISQQTILQWSLAAFAAIAAAGLIGFRSNGGEGASTGLSGTLLMIVFGLGLPGLGFFAYLVWWGEFKRMERAGHYVRGLEAVAWVFVNQGSTGTWVPPPLQWESFLGGDRVERTSIVRSPKILLGYFGTAAIYGGFVTASLVTYLTIVAGHDFHSDPASDRVLTSLAFVWSGFVTVSFAVVTGVLYRSAGNVARAAGRSSSALGQNLEHLGVQDRRRRPMPPTGS